MDKQMSFTVGGNPVSLTQKDVEAALKNIEPGPIIKYWVTIGGKKYPIKQVVSVATKIPTAAFVSTDAFRILTRLGFQVQA